MNSEHSTDTLLSESMKQTEIILSATEIKAEAQRLGFYSCGIAPAEPVAEEHRRYFEDWLQQGAYGSMDYLANHAAMRFDPRELVPGTRSIVCVALNYYPSEFMDEQEGCLSWYAYGKDYHEVMKDKLRRLMAYILNLVPEDAQAEILPGRVFCDTAPVLERYWAWKAGLGWIGRNHQLIIPQAGSTFFLGEIFLTLPVDSYDSPQKNRCGHCRKCLDACPTRALTAEGFDARHCLSYLTIENRDEIPQWAATHMEPCFYGCDRCQASCPHLRFTRPTQEKEFHLREELKQMTRQQWQQLSVEDYRKLFRGSAVKRAKYEGLMRNIRAMNHPDQELTE